MSNPNYKRLGDIVNFKRGYDLPVQDRIEGPYPIISSSGISGYHDQYKVEGEGLVTGRYGTLGKMHYVNGKYWPHNTALYATDFKGNYPKYIYYLMTCLGNLKTSDKSAVPGINRNDLHELNIPFINHDRQKPIADLLWSLDSKIELNNRINAELEAMAKTIYDYWFVQFDFPISKELATQMGKPELEGRPYKSSGGKMVYNKELKREVPEGWGVKSLADLTCRIQRGISPKYCETGGVAVINQKCVRNKTIDFSLARRNDPNKRDPFKKLVQVGDVVVNSTGVGTLGRVAIVKRLPETQVTVDSHVTVVRADSTEINKNFLGYALTERQPEIEQIGVGSTGQTELSRDELGKLPFLVPSEELQKSFANIFKPVSQKMAKNEEENQELASLRDWLLPMLMNGQVKVGEAKEYVQEEKPDRDRVGMAAENREEYGKLSIPTNKAAFAKQVLGGKIVSLFKDDPHFTHIKFQKLQYLAEQIAEADLNWNYYRQAAGPYDPRFMHSVALKLKRSKWFAEKDYRYYSLEKVDQVDKYYLGYFGPKQGILQNLFDKLYNFTEDESEIIATLYAVWNNRILDQLEISDDLLISDFREWSSRKLRYSDEQLLQGLEWMNKTGFVPRGFGYKIKEKKVN